jgi:membrane protein
VQYVPTLEPLGNLVTFGRYAVAVVVLVISLLIVHAWLPAGRRSFIEIVPGIVATLLLWLIAGSAFGRYLANYAFAYVSMYAGLASAMIALVFLYVCASIFIYGGELNSVIAQRWAKRRERQGKGFASATTQPAPTSTSESDPFKPEATAR